MKRTIKAIIALLFFAVVIPLLMGFATAALWNNIVTSVCGFSFITFWQGVGLFVLGQILSGGFLMGCFFVMGTVRHIMAGPHGDLRQHWHNMTDEERKAFMERRAAFGFRGNHYKEEDAEK